MPLLPMMLPMWVVAVENPKALAFHGSIYLASVAPKCAASIKLGPLWVKWLHASVILITHGHATGLCIDVA